MYATLSVTSSGDGVVEARSPIGFLPARSPLKGELAGANPRNPGAIILDWEAGKIRLV